MGRNSEAEIWVGVTFKAIEEKFLSKQEDDGGFDAYDFCEEMGIDYTISFDGQDDMERIYGTMIEGVKWGHKEISLFGLNKKISEQSLIVAKKLSININLVKPYLVSVYF